MLTERKPQPPHSFFFGWGISLNPQSGQYCILPDNLLSPNPITTMTRSC